jgi:hypothetical protein
MMDFVVSKVAMSICALMVVSALGGMFGTDALLGHRGYLEDILDDFCSVTNAVALSGAEASMFWSVPFASGGGIVLIELNGSIVWARSGSDRAVDQPISTVRTWTHDGRPLNKTMLIELDKGSHGLLARSGDVIVLRSRIVSVDNEQKMFVFAYVGA